MNNYNKSQLKNISEATVGRANSSIIDHNKGRQVFDSEFAISVIDAQVRCELEIKRLKNPESSVIHWPENNPVIGEMICV